MRLLRVFACLLVVATFAKTATAEVPPKVADGFIFRHVMDVRMIGTSKSTAAGFRDTAESQYAPEVTDYLVNLIVSALDEKKLIAALQAAFEKELTPEDIEAANAFFESDFAVSRYKAEVAALRSEEPFTKQKEILTALEADKERLALVRSIEAATHETEVGIAVGMSFTEAMVRAGTAQATPEVVADAEQQLKALRSKMAEDLLSINLAQIAYAHRDFSNEQIRSYAAYLDTETARKAYGIFMEQVNDHYTRAGKEIEAGTAALMGP